MAKESFVRTKPHVNVGRVIGLFLILGAGMVLFFNRTNPNETPPAGETATADQDNSIPIDSLIVVNDLNAQLVVIENLCEANITQAKTGLTIGLNASPGTNENAESALFFLFLSNGSTQGNTGILILDPVFQGTGVENGEPIAMRLRDAKPGQELRFEAIIPTSDISEIWLLGDEFGQSTKIGTWLAAGSNSAAVTGSGLYFPEEQLHEIRDEAVLLAMLVPDIQELFIDKFEPETSADAQPQTGDTGFFFFFDADNVELVIDQTADQIDVRYLFKIDGDSAGALKPGQLYYSEAFPASLNNGNGAIVQFQASEFEFLLSIGAGFGLTSLGRASADMPTVQINGADCEPTTIPTATLTPPIKTETSAPTGSATGGESATSTNAPPPTNTPKPNSEPTREERRPTEEPTRNNKDQDG